MTPTLQAPPLLTRLHPPAAMPGGEIELHGSGLTPTHSSALPHATLNGTATPLTLLRPTRATLRVPSGTLSGDVVFTREGQPSNPLRVRIATPMADNLHPVASPAVDPQGNVFATFSGTRGQQVPVSIFRIAPDLQSTPFVRDLLNPTGLAFDREGFLYASSRADGTVYRISPEGDLSLYAEGLGIATGIAFDPEGNLFVGDRTGTIFKITPGVAPDNRPATFVFATLEPSIAAYHLAFNSTGTLFVTGPTTSSNQAIHAIDRDGNTSIFFQGLGRAQGLAFDRHDNLYVAASLHGQRGIVRINPDRHATLALSGNNLIGLCLLPHGAAVLATRDSLFHIQLEAPDLP